MSTSELFRHYAQQCIELAEISGESNRDLMLEMASRWRKLADLEQRDEELDANEKEVRHAAGALSVLSGFAVLAHREETS